MELKPGYKQTEVGVIPEDWEVLALSEITESKRPISYGIVQTGPNIPGGVRCIRVVDINEGLINQSGLITTSRQISEAYSRTILKSGDLVMPLRGKIGDVGLVSDELEGTNLTRGVALIAIRSGWSAMFCQQAISASATRKRLEQAMNGSALQEIPIASLRSFKLPLPPLPEQRAIATALSEVDGLIRAQEQLIAKKRDLKQAAMQQLLTAQHRLPGFSGEWVTKRLGEIGEISSAGVDKKIRPGERPVRLLNYLDVYHRDFIYSHELDHPGTASPAKAERCAVRKGDVFFTPSSETRDDIGHSAVAMEDMSDVVYSYHIARLRITDDWDLRFRTYAFKTKAFYDQASMLCDGSGTRYVISQNKFRSMTVLIPPTKAEQTAIAEVLSDMDEELAALETRLAKTRALKQGMMQSLLTGRIRLA